MLTTNWLRYTKFLLLLQNSRGIKWNSSKSMEKTFNRGRISINTNSWLSINKLKIIDLALPCSLNKLFWLRLNSSNGHLEVTSFRAMWIQAGWTAFQTLPVSRLEYWITVLSTGFLRAKWKHRKHKSIGMWKVIKQSCRLYTQKGNLFWHFRSKDLSLIKNLILLGSIHHPQDTISINHLSRLSKRK